MKELSVDDKKIFGPLLNELKKWSEDIYNIKTKNRTTIADQELHKKQHFDVTAYKHSDVQGSLHIFTHIIEQLEDIFISMGYEIAMARK